MLISSMNDPINILLAGRSKWAADVFREVLAAHGCRVIEPGCGFTPLVIGHSFPGEIDLLIVEVDYEEPDKGETLAANLRVLRPRMRALYFTVEYGTILVGSESDLSDAKEFTPAGLLKEVPALFDSVAA